MLKILVIIARVVSIRSRRQTSSQVYYSTFPNRSGWKPIFFYTFYQSKKRVFFLLLLQIFFLLLKVVVFSYCRMDCGGENIVTGFCQVAQIQLICLTYRLVRMVFALQKALVIMRVSCRSLSVSVSDLLFVCTFELQSESSANMIHILWLFLHCWFCCV